MSARRCWTSASAAGRIAPGEKDRFYIPYGWRFDGTKPLFIFCHGAGGDYRVGPLESLALIDALGCPWAATDLAGATTWAGDAVLDRIDDVFAYMVANYGVRDDKFCLWGGSMGGLNEIIYALERPENVLAVGGGIPVTDPQYVHDNDIGGFAASIEAVYGGPTVPNDRQPKLRGADWDPSVPGKFWYSTNDNFTPLASTQAFLDDAAAAGVEGVSLGAVGHNYLSTDPDDVVDFFESHIFASPDLPTSGEVVFA